MNGGEMILNRIKSDCDESIKAILLDAQQQSDRIMAAAQKQADKSSLEIAEKAKQKLAQISASSKSRTELETRNALLKRRRSEIDKTLTALHRYLTELDDKDYFDALYRLAAQLKGKSGELLLNEKDLSRLPNDFEDKLRAAGLNAFVSKKPVNISGGFVLKCGDIEENMDFAALIDARQDELEDLINRELFAD